MTPTFMPLMLLLLSAARRSAAQDPSDAIVV
jgi:hypothetical protein